MRPLNRHPDEITLQSFQEGLLSGRRRDRVQEHVGRCEACQKTLAAYARLNEVLACVPAMTAEAPVELAEQILTHVLAQRLVTPSTPPLTRLWGITGGLAALALAGMLVLWPMFHVGGAADLVSNLVKIVLTGAQLIVPVGRALIALLEPLRYPALATGAAMMALFAWLASRRLAPEELPL
jgi:predicted anti-sigma-YlaC factor YlaD